MCSFNSPDDDEDEDNVVQEAFFKSDAMDVLLDQLQMEDTQGRETLLPNSCQLIAELAKTGLSMF